MAYITGGKLIDAGDMSGNITSDILVCEDASERISFQATAPLADHVGSIAIQYSAGSPLNWTDIPPMAIPIGAGAALNEWREDAEPSARFYRAVYTRSGGSGALTLVATRMQKRS